MKNKFLKLVGLFLTVMLLVVSCSKDEEQPLEKPEKKLTKEQLIGAEQAYPNEKREVVKVNARGAEIKCDKIGDKYFYQGDILLDFSKIKTKGAAINKENYRWKNNVFVYKIDSNFPEKQRIYDAFKLFEKTNIIFKERTDEKNYALFKYIVKAGCYSYVGMIDEGEQEIVIDTWGTAGNVAHEIGHALGLKHEQSRPDRDKYIKIIEGNVKKGKKHNFDVIPSKWHPIALDNFDFSSIMLYHSWSFSIAEDKSKPTIVKLDGTTFTRQRKKLSDEDIKIINYLYPKIKDLTIEKEQVRLEVGKETSIKINTGNGNYTVTSSDTNKAYATEKEGVITIRAKAEGTVMITVKDNKTEQTKTVKVIVDDLSTYMELTTTKAVGEAIKLAMKADEQDKKHIWIDLNNNRKKDANEGDVQFYSDWPKDNDYKAYTLGNQTIRVYGRVKGFHTDTKWEKQNRIGQNITNLDISKNEELEVLTCSSNQLTSIDVSKNINLNNLLCGGNQLNNLDISQNRELQVLICNENQLKKLDVTRNTQLYQLSCDNNNISNLDVANNIKLLWLTCEGNKLSSLDISNNKKLLRLECGSNQLNSLDVSNNTYLQILKCGSNQLTSLDVSNNTKLLRLSCDNNQITSLDVSQNLKLEELYCNRNQLNRLDLSQNTDLVILQCVRNQLSSLDVSNNTNLQKLYCFGNELSSLDVSNCPKLGIGKDAWGNLNRFDCTFNLNLKCIKVSQEQLDNTDRNWKKDYTATYNTNCE